jgi:hypothetical protein
MSYIAMKKLYTFGFQIFILLSFLTLSSSAQTQIGENINVGESDFALGFTVDTALDGTRVAVGGYGKSAYGFQVYDLIDNNWIPLPTILNTEYPDEICGYAVAISGDGSRVAVGSVINDPNDDFGHLKIYEYDGTTWNQMGPIIYGEDPGDLFGLVISMSTDGNRIIVGAKFNSENGNSAGHARVFEYDGNEWDQIGNDIDGDHVGTYYGTSVSISPDGTRVAVGANQYAPVGGSRTGITRVYELEAGVWQQLGNDLLGLAELDNFGAYHSLSLDGNRIVVGAAQIISKPGYAQVFELDGSTWNQIGSTLVGAQNGDVFGIGVSISGDGSTIAVGAISNPVNQNGAGHVKMYRYNGTDWRRIGEIIEGDDSNDQFGEELKLSNNGSVLAVASNTYEYPVSGTEEGYVKVYDVTNLPLALEDLALSDFVIYPNPAVETITCHNCDLVDTVKIFDAFGKFIVGFKNISQPMDISQLSNGMYFLELSGVNFRQQVKLIKG